MTNGSFRHGTEEGFNRKCPCTKCVNWQTEEYEPNAALIAAAKQTFNLPDSPPPTETPDIVPYLRAAKFNRIEIEQISGEWAVTIKTNGDRWVGFGHLPDHAFHAALNRVRGSDPVTGPLTMTYDQRTLETSVGRALSDGNTEEIDKIWDEADTSVISSGSHETTLEGRVVQITNEKDE